MTQSIACQDSSDRSAFLDARKGRLGSSEIATVCGLNKYKTPLYLWSEMTGKIPVSEKETDDQWLGHQLEPVVAQMFARRTGFAIERCGKTFTRDDIPWAVGTPDYLFRQSQDSWPFILECKTTSQWNADEWNENIPDAAHLQVHFQMGITGIPEAEVAGLIGGKVLQHYPASFNQHIFEQLVQLGENFMKCVREDTPPPAQAADKDLLALINGDISEETITLSEEEVSELVRQFMKLDEKRVDFQKSADEIEKQLKDIKARLQQKMGSAGKAFVDHWVIEQKRRNRKGYVAQATSWVEVKIKEAK